MLITHKNKAKKIEQPKDINVFSFRKYTNVNGFSSYYWQVFECMEDNCDSVLVIGQGDNIVPAILRSQGKAVDTFDFIEEMCPTYLGDIRNISRIVEQNYDIVLCCQVLEHLPFCEFENIMIQLSNIAKKHVVISLPVKGRHIYIKFEGPLKLKFTIKICIPTRKIWTTHFWEVNSKKSSKKIVKSILQRHLDIRKVYRVNENPYHMFFVTDVKS